jgi:predicted transcriptional regulator of viral defense system
MKILTDLAEGQWGLLTAREAKLAGVATSSLDFLHQEGLLDRVTHGVYRVRGAGEPDHLALRAAWLQLDPARRALRSFPTLRRHRSTALGISERT